ncbi:MAG: TonB-dependent receptor [Gemmatimonadetes bacterium]|nr:TonB-dependent receptor [Gemmatimonadota bacterium]
MTLSRLIRPTLLAAALVASGVPSPARAQVAQATVSGTVRSQGGRPIGGARVETADGANKADADAAGRFRLSVPTGDVRVKVSAIGFRPVEIPVSALNAGEVRPIGVTLAPLYTLVATTILATQERPLLNTENAATGGSIEKAEIQALPTDARDPIALLFNIPGITQAAGFFGDAPQLSFNAQNSLYTTYLLDGLDNTEGFLGGPRVEFPLAGLDRMDALVNSYSSEYGRSPSGIVNQVTRGGSNVRHGELFLYGRPGLGLGVDGDNKIPYGAVPAAVARDQQGFKRFQLSGRMRTIGYSSWGLFGRVDQAWNSEQFTTFRAAFSITDRAGTGSGIVTPEADNVTRRIGGLYALTHRTSLDGGNASNTISAQVGTYHWYFPPANSDFSKPQVTIVGPGPSYTPQAVVGSTNFVFDETELQLELRDVYERAIGTDHTLRVGGDIVRSGFELFAAGTNPLGSYVVVNNGNINPPNGRPVRYSDIPSNVQVLSYTVDARPQQVNLSQTVYGAFIEDRWKVTPSFTLITGLRWDYDDITSRGLSSADLSGFQPRVSFNWYATPRSVVRGGIGMYAGKFPYATYSDAQQLGVNGNATVTFSGASAPAFGQGQNAAALAAAAGTLPPHEVFAFFPFGLKMPMGYQATLGYQLQVGDDWGFSVDVVGSRTINLPRLLDLNPVQKALTPADTANQVCASASSCPGDAFRPQNPGTTGYRRLSAAQSGGQSLYGGLYLSARKRLARSLTVDANYVLSRAMSDAEDINFSATQRNCFGEDRRDALTGAPCSSTEWGRANNDRTHRATLRTVWTPWAAWRFSAVADLQSGQPFTRVAGVTTGGSQSRYDLLGSGPIRGNGFIGNNDRYYGVDRNVEQLPHYENVNLSATYLMAVGAQVIEFRADLFNLTNYTAWGNFANGVGGGGSRVQTGRVGDPIYNFNPGPPRQLQLSVRWGF